MPRISAMYNMDLGTHHISGISATEPLKDDLDAVFAPVKDLDTDMPFEVELVDWLLKGDPNCCPQGGEMVSLGEDGPVVYAVMLKEQPDGSLERVEVDPEELEKLEQGEEPACGDSPRKRVVVSGGCGLGAGGEQELTIEDLKAMGLLPEDIGEGVEIEGGEGKRKMVAIGSSDQSVFLAAGVPGFWWHQRGDSTVRYPIHTTEDTYDKVIPEYLEHSATVIALGALGTANLDHMLSREKLTKPETVEAKQTETPGCAPGCGDTGQAQEAKQVRPKAKSVGSSCCP
jgi:hypothetical protein